MRTAYLEGRSIAARARDYGVSRGAIRTAVAGLMPDHTAIDQENTPMTWSSPSSSRRSPAAPTPRALYRARTTYSASCRLTPNGRNASQTDLTADSRRSRSTSASTSRQVPSSR